MHPLPRPTQAALETPPRYDTAQYAIQGLVKDLRSGTIAVSRRGGEPGAWWVPY